MKATHIDLFHTGHIIASPKHHRPLRILDLHAELLGLPANTSTITPGQLAPGL